MRGSVCLRSDGTHRAKIFDKSLRISNTEDGFFGPTHQEQMHPAGEGVLMFSRLQMQTSTAS
jgi:hypothetical protein